MVFHPLSVMSGAKGLLDSVSESLGPKEGSEVRRTGAAALGPQGLRQGLKKIQKRREKMWSAEEDVAM